MSPFDVGILCMYIYTTLAVQQLPPLHLASYKCTQLRHMRVTSWVERS